MHHTRQDKITIKIFLNEKAPQSWRVDTPPRYVTLYDYTATAFRKLYAAGRFGVHFREFRRDALARFAQNNLPFKTFADIKRGSRREEWCRLDFFEWQSAEIVEDSMMVEAA